MIKEPQAMPRSQSRLGVPAWTGVLVMWLVGTALMLTRLGLRIRTEHRDEQVAIGQNFVGPRPSFITQGVPVTFAKTRRSPAA